MALEQEPCSAPQEGTAAELRSADGDFGSSEVCFGLRGLGAFELGL